MKDQNVLICALEKNLVMTLYQNSPYVRDSTSLDMTRYEKYLSLNLMIKLDSNTETWLTNPRIRVCFCEQVCVFVVWACVLWVMCCMCRKSVCILKGEEVARLKMFI